MKTDIHPEWFPEAAVTCQCGNSWTTGATVAEIRTEICSACHPFFTGEQRIVDTEGRVDKFMKRLQRRDSLREERTSSTEADALPVDMPVSELGISGRYVSILEENDIHVAGDVKRILDEQGDAGLTDLSGIGAQTLIDIKKSMRQQGFEVPDTEVE